MSKIVKKIKTIFFVQLHISESRGFFEMTWKNMIESRRPQMTDNMARVLCMLNK
jgi:hypothetical protein